MPAVDDRTFTIKTHVSLNVRNVDESVAFYEALFGQPAHKRRPGYANFDLSTPPLKLALNQHAPDMGAGPLNHLGLQVSTMEMVDTMRQRVESAGLPFTVEEATTCCFAVQNKIWVHDPDGNAWEVYYLLDDLLDNPEAEDGRDGTKGACCAPGVTCSTTPVSLTFTKREIAR